MHPTGDQDRSSDDSRLYEHLATAHDLVERLHRLHEEVRLLAERDSDDDPARRRRALRAWTGLGPAVAACRSSLPMIEFLKGEIQRSAGAGEKLGTRPTREGR